MLCARLMRHKPDAQRSRFDLAAERVLRPRSSPATAAALDVVLRHQVLTLMVALATLGVTAALYVAHPQGLLPVAGHRRDPGHVGRAAGCLLRARWCGCRANSRRSCSRTRTWYRLLLRGRGRRQPDAQFRPLPDQPEAAGPARRRHRRDHPPHQSASRRRAPAPGSTCSRRRTSPSTPASPARQYKFVLENANPALFRNGRRNSRERLRQAPELADVANDLQQGARRWTSSSTATPPRASA